ncbi:MAG: hypothetical protein JWN90_275 [Parcubacteria group bacterium]|nr:hypothetical protein [Parcubacteria group bacterium]
MLAYEDVECTVRAAGAHRKKGRKSGTKIALSQSPGRGITEIIDANFQSLRHGTLQERHADTCPKELYACLAKQQWGLAKMGDN